MRSDFQERVEKAVKSIRTKTQAKPKVGLILGSGLSGISDQLDGIEIPYSDIDGFPEPTVAGHKGILKIGEETVTLAGRFHFYEGWTMDEVVLPTALLHGLGVETLIVTNAAGAVNKAFAPGNIVLLKDHINLMGTNPLIGPNDAKMGPRFPDMTYPYDRELRDMVKRIAPSLLSKPEDLKEGVYAAFTGPSYETPAEIKMCRIIGADMVGMSTVPEVITANRLGMKVIGISCATNMAAGILDQPLNHEEVVETGRKVQNDMVKLIMGIVQELNI
ncbi:purine-nucleoside phosphorylase [Spirochaeta isovalerica]|uniref:Purine nucleoside phosphorylase n=1 Tax=Spirochaeta isovalerica TaxID=150 RepID=A0A841R1C1_9SPIO|nr:purine-nucleoside phosphorylase [Spirochaeta isovalerica]MBB6478774.1 purine-nucleoside phosphorylase [Spirochaeta isovalerica]